MSSRRSTYPLSFPSSLKNSPMFSLKPSIDAMEDSVMERLIALTLMQLPKVDRAQVFGEIERERENVRTSQTIFLMDTILRFLHSPHH